MCFYTENGSLIPLRAEEDIKVYKILFTQPLYVSSGMVAYRAYVQTDFLYSPNRLYSLDKLEVKEWGRIDEGFHSYESPYRAYEQSNKSSVSKICEFIIPKGAEYFYNNYLNEYVSTSIVSGDLTDLSDNIADGKYGPVFCAGCHSAIEYRNSKSYLICDTYPDGFKYHASFICYRCYEYKC